jgi:putative transposase
MPNHYHLLLRQESDSSISNYIGIAFNAYTQAFNRMYHRSGTLFEGRFRHVVIDADSYVLHLCRYLHLNPVSANIVTTPEEWEYSDYQEWIGSRSRWRIDKDFISRYFTSGKEYRDFVIEYLEDKKKDNKITKYIFD